jgi:hypothetical protein
MTNDEGGNMEPVKFAESNYTFGPPEGLDESQCRSVPAFVGQVKGGSVDGLPVVVVAWMPDAVDMLAIREGKPIYLSMVGVGLAPHFLTTDFEGATHPA